MKKTLWTLAIDALVLVGCLVTILVVASKVSAQGTAATSASKITWDQPANSLAEAQGFFYRAYPDGATVASAAKVLTATCSGTVSPYLCTAPYPAFTPGAHTVVLTSMNGVGDESLPSTPPFAFTFTVRPGAPLNVR